MKVSKIFVLFVFVLTLSICSQAQMTTVTATVIDSDTTVWANGTWGISFVPNPSQPSIGVYKINGTPLSSSVLNQTGSLNSSGALSVSVYQNGVITPVGSQWQLKVCPNAVTKCGYYTFNTAQNSSLDVSSQISAAAPPPRFTATSGTYGYTDNEASVLLIPGATYWNVTLLQQRYWNGTIWISNGSGGPYCLLTGCTYTGTVLGPDIGGIFYCDQYPGADGGAKIANCLAAVEAAGGGTANAQNFTSVTAAENIVNGDGTHPVTLLLPGVPITFASGYNYQYHSYTNTVGAGVGSTIFQCYEVASKGCVQSYNEASAVKNVTLNNFSIQPTGSTVSSSIGLGVGGCISPVVGSHCTGGYPDVQNSYFSNIQTIGFDIARNIGGNGGCTCYNSFYHVFNQGRSYGTVTANYSAFSGDVNSNQDEGGTSWGTVSGTGVTLSGGGGNVLIKPDIENSSNAAMVVTDTGDAIIIPYEEAAGPTTLNGSRNAIFNLYQSNWLPDTTNCVDCLILTPGSQLWASGFTPATVGISPIYNWDMIPRGTPVGVHDTMGNGGDALLNFAGPSNQSLVWSRAGMYQGGVNTNGGFVSPANLSSLPIGASARTLSAFVKIPDLGNLPLVPNGTLPMALGGWGTQGTNTSWEIYIESSGYMSVAVSDNGVTSRIIGPSISVADNAPHLLTASYDGTNVKQCVDAVNCNSTAATVNTPASKIWIGSRIQDYALEFAGVLSDVSVWGSALTSAQLSKLYLEGTQKIPGFLPSTNNFEGSILTSALITNPVTVGSAPSGTATAGGLMTAATIYAYEEVCDATDTLPICQGKTAESAGVTVNGTSTNAISWTLGTGNTNATICFLWVGASGAESTNFTVPCAGGTLLQGANVGNTPPSINTSIIPGTVQTPYIKGLTTAPSGSCLVNGTWAFSSDGHLTYCSSGTWATKI